MPESSRAGLKESPSADRRLPPVRWWLHLLLLVLTAVTTTTFGSALAVSFHFGRPFNQQDLLNSFVRLIHGDRTILQGIAFSGPLLLILMAHELGHYFACLERKVDATLPYFMPSPTLFGTLGAFIRITSPIYTRRDLFAIGSAGPIAGFVALLPFLIVGVWASRPIASSMNLAAIIIAQPPGLHAVQSLFFGNLPASTQILLHPTAMAALAGMIMTALNLLPLGQLDGGHIVYALFGERGHRIISTVMVGLLVVMGKFYFPWWFWAVVMFFLGRRHPLVYDESGPSGVPKWLAVTTLLIFLFCISLVPTRI